MNQQPFKINRIGIALAAYSPDPRVFSEQLESIRHQTFPDWVCVITCDSPLGPLRTAPELQEYFKDDRFVWLGNADRLGHKKNFERAIQETLRFGVDAIACSDQDDIWAPEKLATCAKALSAAGPLSLVHTDLRVLRKGVIEGNAWSLERRGVGNARPAHLLVRNVVAGCASLFDAELARRFPVIPEAAEFHDHWYALAAASLGRVQPVYEPLVTYRQHDDNVVGVSPFRGLFWLGNTAGSFRKILDKCGAGWLKSHRLAGAAAAAGIRLGPLTRAAFLRHADLGLGILLLGVRNIRRDPALARACFARGLGKLYFSFSLRRSGQRADQGAAIR